MSQDNDNLLTRKIQLSRLEHLLQDYIRETTDILSTAFTFTPNTRESLTSSTTKLRLKMIKLRQWRNNRERYTASQLEHFVLDILNIRLENLRVRQLVLQDTLTHIDGVLSSLARCPGDVISQRDVIGNNLDTLEERLEGAANAIGEEWLLTSENKMASLEGEVIRLRRLVKEINKTKSGRKMKASSSEMNLKIPFEHHPEVNRVLRNAGRIRKLIKILSEGGHMEIASNPDCLTNDLEVLHRQLSRIQQWQNDDANFTKHNVDDLEVIFAAIASHLKPEVDLDQSNTNRSSISRSSSSNSDHSPDCGCLCPSPYAESTISKTDGFYQSDIDVAIGAEDNNADVIDERLI